MNTMVYKPFDTEVAWLGDYVLTWSPYDDDEGFVKNWYEIFRLENNEYISEHLVSGFSYSSEGIKEYFIKYVNKLHNEETKNTI